MHIKKKLFLFSAFLGIILAPNIATTATQISTNETYINPDIPSDYIEGYTFGDYNIYGSHEKEDELINSAIWLQGTMNEEFQINEVNQIAYTSFTDSLGNSWLVYLEDSSIIDKFNALISKNLCLKGSFSGHINDSEVPSLTIVSILDIENNKVETTLSLNTTSIINSDNSSSSTVWLSANDNKYHCVDNCSRKAPNKATQVQESDAKRQGYVKCDKCY